ncbi:cupin domain-containing protein [Ekhidna sp.]
MDNVADLIAKLDLEPHPEGGYFKETYRSEEYISAEALSEEYVGSRNHSTCIYFLLTSDTFSAFHKINQDEIWHFYQGSPIQLHTISEEGNHEEFLIGSDLSEGQSPQLVVPGNHWFAAKVITPDSYALLGCTVAPGFDFQDFTLAVRKKLIELFPQHSDLITEFTRED